MSKFKIVSISCIKNECDIIEAFVKINSRIIDTFVFIDDSSDKTTEILRNLIKDGYKIILLDRQIGEDYNQGGLLTAALNFLVTQFNSLEFDYILPLDCDEFPNSISLEDFTEELSQIPEGFVGSYVWETYIPTTLDFPNLISNGLIDSFQKRVPEGRIFPKIIISRDLVGKIVVGTGSHNAIHLNGINVNEYRIDSKLAHFPVRSAEQIIRKNFSAVDGLMRKKERVQGEGFHVYNTMASILKKNICLNLEDIQMIANEYANPNPILRKIGLDEVQLLSPKWIPNYTLSYHDFSKIDFANCFGEIIINSWLNPIAYNDFSDLRQALIDNPSL